MYMGEEDRAFGSSYVSLTFTSFGTYSHYTHTFQLPGSVSSLLRVMVQGTELRT